jgi:hypothetical protein
MVEANNAEISALKTAHTSGNNGGSSSDKASKRAARAAKYAWQKVPPADGEQNTPKILGDRKYHWCTKLRW